jgi:hypothetical protein
MPIISAMSNISSGLRLSVGFVFGSMKNKVHVSVSNPPSVADVSKIWSALLHYPITSVIRFDSVNETESLINTALDTLLRRFESILTQSTINMKSSRDNNLDTLTFLRVERLNALAPHVLSIIVFSRIDFFVGRQLISCLSIYKTFQLALNKLVATYLANESERKRKVAEKESFYKYRTNTTVYESNELKEIEEDIKRNFPKHLEELEATLGKYLAFRFLSNFIWRLIRFKYTCR